MNIIKNIFDTKNTRSKDQEVFESLINTKDIKVERIVTLKPYDKPGEWYDQEKDEWVLLLKGEAKLEFAEEKIIKLTAGDYIFISAHKKHRISHSSINSQCIWLAIHGNFK